MACLGKPPVLLASDPVIAEALKTGHVASIEVEKSDITAAAGVLVAIPLVDVHQKIWGVVVVNEMPLFALQESTMDFLAVLGGKMGDLIKRRAEAYSNDNDDRKAVEIRLSRILREINYLKASAVAIVVIISSEELRSQFAAKFQAELRGVDEILIFKDKWDRHVFLILLPYTDENGGHEFLNRIELSTLTAETACHGLERMSYHFRDGNIGVCMWILDHQTSREKLLLEVDQFRNNEFSCSVL